MTLKDKKAAVPQVTGKIDLEGINEKTRPARLSKEERDALREQKAEEQRQYNHDFAIRTVKKKMDDLHQQIAKMEQDVDAISTRAACDDDERAAMEKEQGQATMRLNYLRHKATVREKYNNFAMTNDERQQSFQFFGIRPKKMDVVHFHVPNSSTTKEMDGIALAKDENHYYFAVDMYDQPDHEDNATTLMDENPDGTFEGIWPKQVVLKAAGRFEERYMRNLTDKYADELSDAESLIENMVKQEQDEIDTLLARIAEIQQQLEGSSTVKEELEHAKSRWQELRVEYSKAEAELKALTATDTPALSGSPTEESVQEDIIQLVDNPADADLECRCPHLPYLRGKRQMFTMDWPAIDYDYVPWMRFRLMGNISRQMNMLQEAHAITYILNEEYYEELCNRGRNYYKGMRIEDVTNDNERTAGVIVYPSQGFEDTVLFVVNRSATLNMSIVYIREGRLLFYESYSEQEIVGKPRTDSYLCKSLRESGTGVDRLFSWLRNFVTSFLAMERDMERTINHLVEEGGGEKEDANIATDDPVDTADDKDVAFRDASWYTDITVNRQIPVRGYISHRLCGKGQNKYIREVWVRSYVKSGYHRAASVKQ